jgi:Concanavalin A-like lectin/glucanases superfamily
MGNRVWLPPALLGAALLAACELVVSLDGLSGPPVGDEGGVDARTSGDGATGDGATSDGGLDARSSTCGDASDPSLVAWFPFDEGAGNTATDCARSGLLAVSVGDAAVAWTTGRIGGAIDMKKGTSCLALGLAAQLAFEGAPFTVMAWLDVALFTTSGLTGRHVISRKSPFGWHFGTDDPFSVELDFEREAGKFEAKTPVDGGVWVHAAMVYRPGQSVQAYVNGTLARTVVDPPPSTGVAASTQT